MMKHINLDQYLLRLFFVISLSIATLAMFRMGPEFPVFSVMKLGVTALSIAFTAYLTAFLGVMAYMTSRTRVLDEALEASGHLERFTRSLLEPMHWANWSLALTLTYYVSTNYPAPLVWAVIFSFAAATIATTAFSIFRNFHLLRMFLTTTMRAVVAQLQVKELVMGQIKDRIDQIVAEGGCDDPNCQQCNPDPVDTDSTVN